tara:strand:- start:851 stop:1033 length:183 start_codon:yes stop_codon:yes gene_type:complete
MELQVIEIPNIHAFQGMIPAGKNLTVYEEGTDPLDGYVLYGFDEIGMFDAEFKTPAYCFC